MRLHLVDGKKGEVVFDGMVDATIPETALLGPEEDWGKIPPLEREARLRVMASAGALAIGATAIVVLSLEPSMSRRL